MQTAEEEEENYRIGKRKAGNQRAGFRQQNRELMRHKKRDENVSRKHAEMKRRL